MTYPTLAAFYGARPERRRSPEVDYGVHWRDGRQLWPEYRVSYVQATGEVYAVRQAGRGGNAVRVLGVVPPDEDTRRETRPWDRAAAYYRTLEGILDGWADDEVSGFDLAWVEARLTQAAEGWLECGACHATKPNVTGDPPRCDLCRTLEGGVPDDAPGGGLPPLADFGKFYDEGPPSGLRGWAR